MKERMHGLMAKGELSLWDGMSSMLRYVVTPGAAAHVCKVHTFSTVECWEPCQLGKAIVCGDWCLSDASTLHHEYRSMDNVLPSTQALPASCIRLVHQPVSGPDVCWISNQWHLLTHYTKEWICAHHNISTSTNLW